MAQHLVRSDVDDFDSAVIVGPDEDLLPIVGEAKTGRALGVSTLK
jgi:hypothetical protein